VGGAGAPAAAVVAASAAVATIVAVAGLAAAEDATAPHALWTAVLLLPARRAAVVVVLGRFAELGCWSYRLQTAPLPKHRLDLGLSHAQSVHLLQLQGVGCAAVCC
jgi:hypothetical protein